MNCPIQATTKMASELCHSGQGSRASARVSSSSPANARAIPAARGGESTR